MQNGRCKLGSNRSVNMSMEGVQLTDWISFEEKRGLKKQGDQVAIIKPLSYSVELQPDFEEERFYGRVDIR